MRWSTTPRAWAERGAALAMALLSVGGWWLTRDWDWEPRVVLAALWLALLAFLIRREIIVVLGPVFFYELLRFSRRRVHGTRSIYAGILFVSISYVYFALSSTSRHGGLSLSEQAEMAGTLFLAFFGIQMAIVGLITPMIVAGAIADEKERRTLEFLLASDLRGHEVVLGKLAARVAWVLLALLTGVPVLALLQFFGGIDPGEVIAATIVSLVSLYSVACLSVAMSCLMRRARDAILSTYILMGGYLALSALAGLLSFTALAKLDLTVGETTLTGNDVITAIQAGNLFVGLASLLRRQEAGAAFVEILREVTTNYTLFHLAAGTLFLGWAVYRLRPIALAQAGEDRGGRRRRRVRLFRRPRIKAHPMLWKELFVEPGPRFHLLVRVLILLIVLLSFYFPVQIIVDWWNRLNAASGAWSYPRETFQREINYWLRLSSAAVGTLLLLGVTLRAAGGITGERARQTLDDLLTTPLTNDEILNAKWLGAFLSPRRGWLWLGTIYAVGLATGGVSIVGVVLAVLAVLAWLLYAVFFASLGLWCSVRMRSGFQATTLAMLLAIFALFGHWAVTGLLCYLPLGLMRSGMGELPNLTVPLQLGLTPPFALGALALRTLDEISNLPSGEALGVFLTSFGPFLFAIIGSLLRMATGHHFAEKFVRTDKRRPEKRDPTKP